jgi:tight adherence protein B
VTAAVLLLGIAAAGFARQAVARSRAGVALAARLDPARPEPAVRVPPWVVVAVGAAALVVGRAAPGVLLAGVVAGAVAWRRFGAWSRARARRAAVDALPEAVEAVARALRAGWSLGPAVEQAAAGAPPVLAAELRRLPEAMARGATTTAAISAWSDTAAELDGADLLAAALDLAAAAGGDVAGALDGVADTLRDRRAARRESAALGTQARASAALLGVAPLGFGALAAAIDPRTARFLLTTAAGLACLVAGIVLDIAGWRWMRRISEAVA